MTVYSEKECILDHYQEVKSRIANTRIKLIVISKFQPVSKIQILLDAGQREFGESRIEEIEDKWPALLETYPDIKLHYIGKLQSRKIKQIVKYCQMIHSLDRIDIAKKIANECKNQNKTLECLIQINTGAEPQKGGVLPDNFADFLQECKTIDHLHINGIMCIPPVNQDPLSHFQIMRNLKHEFNLDELSMGMSDDYIKAIQAGATMLRIGEIILGARI